MKRVRDENLGNREQTTIGLLVGADAGIQLHDPDAPESLAYLFRDRLQA